MMATNCEGERSFSKLKLIKNALRSSMCQDRLNALAVIASNHDITRKLNTDEIIRKFAVSKCRRRQLVSDIVLPARDDANK